MTTTITMTITITIIITIAIVLVMMIGFEWGWLNFVGTSSPAIGVNSWTTWVSTVSTLQLLWPFCSCLCSKFGMQPTSQSLRFSGDFIFSLVKKMVGVKFQSHFLSVGPFLYPHDSITSLGWVNQHQEVDVSRPQKTDGWSSCALVKISIFWGIDPFEVASEPPDFRRLRPLLPSHAGPSCHAKLEAHGASRCGWVGPFEGKHRGGALQPPFPVGWWNSMYRTYYSQMNSNDTYTWRVSTVIPGMDWPFTSWLNHSLNLNHHNYAESPTLRYSSMCSWKFS